MDPEPDPDPNDPAPNDPDDPNFIVKQTNIVLSQRISLELASTTVELVLTQQREQLKHIQSNCTVDSSTITDIACKRTALLMADLVFDLCASSEVVPINGRPADAVVDASTGAARFMKDESATVMCTLVRKSIDLCGIPSCFISPIINKKGDDTGNIELSIEPPGLSAKVNDADGIISFHPDMPSVKQDSISAVTVKQNVLAHLQTQSLPDETVVSVVQLSRDDILSPSADQHTNSPIILACVNVGLNNLVGYANRNRKIMKRVTTLLECSEMDVRTWGASAPAGDRGIPVNTLYIIGGSQALSIPLSKPLNSNFVGKVICRDGKVRQGNIAGDIGVTMSPAFVSAFLMPCLYGTDDERDEYFDKLETKQQFFKLFDTNMLSIIKWILIVYGSYFSKTSAQDRAKFWENLSKASRSHSDDVEQFKKVVLIKATDECCDEVIREIEHFQARNTKRAKRWHELSDKLRLKLAQFYDDNDDNTLKEIISLSTEKMHFIRSFSVFFQDRLILILSKDAEIVKGNYPHYLQLSMSQSYSGRDPFERKQKSARSRKKMQLVAIPGPNKLDSVTYIWNGHFFTHKGPKSRRGNPLIFPAKGSAANLEKHIKFEELQANIEYAIVDLKQNKDKYLEMLGIFKSRSDGEEVVFVSRTTGEEVLEKNIKEEIEHAIGSNFKFGRRSVSKAGQLFFFIATEKVTPTMINFILSRDRTFNSRGLFNKTQSNNIASFLNSKPSYKSPQFTTLTDADVVKFKQRVLLELGTELLAEFHPSINGDDNSNNGSKGNMSPPKFDVNSFYLVRNNGNTPQKIFLSTDIPGGNAFDGIIGHLVRHTTEGLNDNYFFVYEQRVRIEKDKLTLMPYLVALEEEIRSFTQNSVGKSLRTKLDVRLFLSIHKTETLPFELKYSPSVVEKRRFLKIKGRPASINGAKNNSSGIGNRSRRGSNNNSDRPASINGAKNNSSGIGNRSRRGSNNNSDRPASRKKLETIPEGGAVNYLGNYLGERKTAGKRPSMENNFLKALRQKRESERKHTPQELSLDDFVTSLMTDNQDMFTKGNRNWTRAWHAMNRILEAYKAEQHDLRDAENDLTDAEIKTYLEEIFINLDEDQSGSITINELNILFRYN
jgi:hypothetical protein